MSGNTDGRTNGSRVTLIALAATAALAIAPVLLVAQPGHGPGPHHGRGRMMERLFERLDLTDDQKEAVHNTMLENREQTQALHEERIAKRRALGQAIHADFFDENAVRQAAADLAAVDADLAVRRAQMFQKINKVLTPEQRERMKDLIEDWHFMADEFRGRPPGRGPGAIPSE